METNLRGILKVVELPEKDINGNYPPDTLYLVGSTTDSHFSLYVSSTDGKRICPCTTETTVTQPTVPDFNYFNTSNG